MDNYIKEPMVTAYNESINQDEDGALIVLSLKWINPDETRNIKRLETSLNKMLQTWFNKHKLKVDCSVKRTLIDGRVVIKTKPAPAVTELQRLSKQTLTGKDASSVTITAISLTLPSTEVDIQIPADASVNLPPSRPKPQTDQVHPGKQSSAVSADEEMHSCSVPVGHFWYVNYMYEEEMKRIEKENGVKIIADVKVRFEVDQKAGSPDKALNEFTNLVQTRMIESCGSVIPLKFVDPDQWRDALKIIQKKENKLLVTLTSKGMTACGPKYSQDVISKSLFGDPMQHTNTHASLHEYEKEFKDTSLKSNLTTQDHLTDAGVTMEESLWMPMTTYHNKQVTKFKNKFNMEFKQSDISQSKRKSKVETLYKKDEGYNFMEGKCLKAQLQLDQKTATFPMRIPQSFGATGFSHSLMTTNNVFQSEGASNEPVLTGQPANRKHNTAGDSEEEKCPICLDTFKNKKQLKCKHEFCEECLQQAKDVNGPICPICSVVFGKIIGDQPEGKMSWNIRPSSLPGFPDCGTIVINYEILDGKQTKRHPNPGQLYWGIRRQAYLPNNSEGNEVLQLLKRAFDQRLIFTIGTSRTTGLDGQVTWNDIHHKTCMSGGPQSFGYPDSNYLNRVKEELKAKGIE